ncbi:ceramide kinase-like isoform X2 [Haliotis asinina]|uniref:ceramide kinase-like isoform X2 n=1 Tax=Haliotis asinina TaxID=109174 RepID=UPI00353196CF
MERERSETSVEVDSNPGQATQLAVGDFVTDSVHVTLSLTEEGISWRNLVDTSEVTLPWFDVITCHRGQVSPKTPTKIIGDLDNNKGFTLHYIDKQANRVWKHKHKTFLSSENNFEDILSTVQEKSKKDRPSRLLVLINPVGGRGQGEAQYRRVVAPLFRLTKIDTEVIVSQSPSHPEELGNTFDFSRVTGVVVVGGDGTLQKLLHTLLPRIQKDAGIQIGTTDADLKALPFPVGMIPTGTGNGIAKGLCGNDDIETAVLNIITGCRIFKNIASISQGDKHLGFSGVIFGHGFWSDLMDAYFEERRLGWLRFPIGMLIAFLRTRREFNVRIDFLPYDPPTDGGYADNSKTETEPAWKTIEGRYAGIMCFPALMRPHKKTPKGVFDVNAEAMTLLMDKQCGRLTFFSWLYKLTQLHMDAVKSLRLRVIPEEGSTDRERRLERTMNLDGELLALESGDLDVNIRLHRNLLEMFGDGTIAEE